MTQSLTQIINVAFVRDSINWYICFKEYTTVYTYFPLEKLLSFFSVKILFFTYISNKKKLKSECTTVSFYPVLLNITCNYTSVYVFLLKGRTHQYFLYW